jgi:hypothetical protein
MAGIVEALRSEYEPRGFKVSEIRDGVEVRGKVCRVLIYSDGSAKVRYLKNSYSHPYAGMDPIEALEKFESLEGI